MEPSPLYLKPKVYELDQEDSKLSAQEVIGAVDQQRDHCNDDSRQDEEEYPTFPSGTRNGRYKSGAFIRI